MAPVKSPSVTSDSRACCATVIRTCSSRSCISCALACEKSSSRIRLPLCSMKWIRSSIVGTEWFFPVVLCAPLWLRLFSTTGNTSEAHGTTTLKATPRPCTPSPAPSPAPPHLFRPLLPGPDAHHPCRQLSQPPHPLLSPPEC